MYSNRVQSVVLRWESFQGINLYIVVVSKKTINKNAQQWGAWLHIHQEKLYFCRRDTFKSTAMDNLEKDYAFSKCALWSDETKLEVFGHFLCLEKEGGGVKEHGGGSIMLWAYFSASGTGNLIKES